MGISSLWNKIKSYWNSRRRQEAFVIRIFANLSHKVEPAHYGRKENIVRNHRYTVLTFFPIILIDQFSSGINLFALIITLVQIHPLLRVEYLMTNVTPLLIVLFVAILREGWDDFSRRIQDKRANSQYVETFQIKNNTVESVLLPSSDLKVGQIVRLAKGSRFPADILVMMSSNCKLNESNSPDLNCLNKYETNASSSIADSSSSSTSINIDGPPGSTDIFYLRTEQLDGEINWKQKRSLNLNPFICDENFSYLIKAEAPNSNIYSFNGSLNFEFANSSSKVKQNFSEKLKFSMKSKDPENELTEVYVDENNSTIPSKLKSNHHLIPLSIENIAWRDSILMSEHVTGIIIHSGSNTRSAMNNSNHKVALKTGKCDREINLIASSISISVVLVAFIMTILRGFHGGWSVYFVRLIIIVGLALPISLRTHIELAKIFSISRITQDNLIKGAFVRSTNIVDELGRIDLILTDKTGTLTNNSLNVVEHVPIGDCLSSSELICLVSMALCHSVQLECLQNLPEHATQRDLFLEPKSDTKLLPLKKFEVDKILNHLVSQSPDEEAIVCWCLKKGIRLLSRNSKSIILSYGVEKNISTYDIKYLIPFTSESKRMGILIEKDNYAHLIVKGADIAIAPLLSSERDTAMRISKEKAQKGQRTMVYARYIYDLTSENEEYSRLKYCLSESILSMADRDFKMQSVLESLLESKMDPVCVVCIEDTLQEGVPDTVSLFQSVGIPIWMATGDALETTLGVGVKAGIINPSMGLKYQHIESLQDLKEFILTAKSICNTLVIEGRVLASLLEEPSKTQPKNYKYSSKNEVNENLDKKPSHNSHKYSINFSTTPNSTVKIHQILKYIIDAKINLICYRCMPGDKGKLAEILKSIVSVCAIGDGGNDVSMIRAASLGIGIKGREGGLAALAGDASIFRFHHLRRLILWHGRSSYTCTAATVRSVLHRGFLIATVRLVIISYLHMAPVSVFSGPQLAYFSSILTAPLIMSHILDRETADSSKKLFSNKFAMVDVGSLHDAQNKGNNESQQQLNMRASANQQNLISSDHTLRIDGSVDQEISIFNGCSNLLEDNATIICLHSDLKAEKTDSFSPGNRAESNETTEHTNYHKEINLKMSESTLNRDKLTKKGISSYKKYTHLLHFSSALTVLALSVGQGIIISFVGIFFAAKQSSMSLSQLIIIEYTALFTVVILHICYQTKTLHYGHPIIFVGTSLLFSLFVKIRPIDFPRNIFFSFDLTFIPLITMIFSGGILPLLVSRIFQKQGYLVDS